MTHSFDKSRLPSRHVSVGPERAPHRSYYYAMGLTEEEIARPFVALASAGNDSAPCNTTLDAQADAARAGVDRGRRHAAPLQHDHRHRRHRDGSSGDEILAGQPRGDRRFGRALGARPLLRRAGRLRGVRQVAARHDDGDAPAQCAVDLRLRRLDPARAASMVATSPWWTCSRSSAAMPPATCPLSEVHATREGRLPRPRRVRRPVSPRTPWPASARRSDCRCRIAIWCPLLTQHANRSRSLPARR